MLEPIHVMRSIQYRYTTISCGALNPYRPYEGLGLIAYENSRQIVGNLLP